MKSTKTMIIYEIMKPKSWFDLVCNHVNITDFSTTKKQTNKKVLSIRRKLINHGITMKQNTLKLLKSKINIYLRSIKMF